MAGPNTRTRSESQDVDSDVEEEHEETSAAGKPGRKKNPNSQAARRDQNRIAQREFRQRKQQRIRDLEARVELLSGNKDEVVYEMRMMLKDLMDENAALRALVKGLGAFLGDGAGGTLAKLGWTQPDFAAFVERSASDTAYESFQRHKGAEQPPAKRARADVPPPASDLSLFSQLVRGAGPPMFVPPVPAAASSSSAAYPPAGVSPSSAGSSSGAYPPYLSPLGLAGTPPGAQSSGYGMEQADPNDVDPKMDEAGKLINYHLENYARNNKYHLPASLRPTDTQQKVPHNRAIDGILIPSIRDHMILFQDKIDLAECMFQFQHDATVHGEDVLSHTNWEVGERWLVRYSMLVDQPVLDVTNRWRRERGDRELTLEDIGPAANSHRLSGMRLR